MITFLGNIKHETTRVTEITEEVLLAIQTYNFKSTFDFLKRNNLFPLSVQKLINSTFDQLRVLRDTFDEPKFMTGGVFHDYGHDLVFDERGRLIKLTKLGKGEITIYLYCDDSNHWSKYEKITLSLRGNEVTVEHGYRFFEDGKSVIIKTKNNIKHSTKNIYTKLDTGYEITKHFIMADGRNSLFDDDGNILYSYDGSQELFMEYDKDSMGNILNTYRKYHQNDPYILVSLCKYDTYGNRVYSNGQYNVHSITRHMKYFYDNNGSLNKIVSETFNGLTNSHRTTVEEFKNILG